MCMFRVILDAYLSLGVVMARIIFAYTPNSIHANQGEEPSLMEGYDIWLDLSSDESLESPVKNSFSFLGFSPLPELQYWVSFYETQGDKVFISRPS